MGMTLGAAEELSCHYGMTGVLKNRVVGAGGGKVRGRMLPMEKIGKIKSTCLGTVY